MPRKRKLEEAQPSAPPTADPSNKYGRWRSRVQELLVTGWQSPDDVESVAATVVGMFDAGASDAEVAAFLHSQELSGEAELLTDEARMKLVRELHSSAGSALSKGAPNDEL